MLNKVWFWLLCIGIVYGFARGSYQSLASDSEQQPAMASEEVTEPPAGLTAMGKRLNDAAIDAATDSVDIVIVLIGVMTLFLGVLNIAKDAGMVDAFARLLSPLMRWLFPEIPDGHPAQGAILMNMSANMLGLDNAATPMGLKAMEELQTLNPVKDTATNSMATFLAINTSSVTIIPFTIIAYRAAKGSENAAEPIFATLLVTTCSTVVAVVAARWLAKRPKYQIASPESPEQNPPTAEATDG